MPADWIKIAFRVFGSLLVILGSTYPAVDLRAGDRFTVGWTNNLLTLSHPRLPGGPVSVFYLEAFLRSGANQQDWRESVLPHKTVLTEADPKGRWLRFRSTVQPQVTVLHEVRAGTDAVEFRFLLHNQATQAVDLQWFQPACIRVAGFTGRDQQSFVDRSFIFTEHGRTWLRDTGRTVPARYLGGQVFPMPGVADVEANPRPIAQTRPVNGLIGCVSADDRWILATASDRTHELFEGVYVCLHSDPHVGGLQPGEQRVVRAKIYFMPNDPKRLLARYRRDFPHQH